MIEGSNCPPRPLRIAFKKPEYVPREWSEAETSLEPVWYNGSQWIVLYKRTRAYRGMRTIEFGLTPVRHFRMPY
jgi:hypothetical protein